MALSDGLLAEQRAYYRARAPEYDDWWERRGRYDRGEAFQTVWETDVADAERALAGFGATGSVIEFAAGTGNWTRHLAKTASHVTALDASPETLAIAASKLERRANLEGGAGEIDRVEFVTGDIFGFEPDRTYDVAFMGFWHSHVPADRLESFWALVDRCLAPDGRFFLIDNAHPSLTQGLAGSPLEVHTTGETATSGQGTIDLAGGTAERTLTDGRSFEIVKRYFTPDSLAEALGDLGWAVEARTTERFFLVADGRRRDQP